MTWGWRGEHPAISTGSGTTGGDVGSAAEAGRKTAWPRYEAEYLKRALQSEQYKYGTAGLDEQQRSVYLEHIVANYKAEADECLKGEFEQWLQGQHEVNDTSREHLYENEDGKPVRRWLMRTPESEDGNGGYKVGLARAGWKHTPWGRASLTHLPGVKDYLRNQKETAHKKDMEMQLLAEFGPQTLDQAWMYFKHWVKGRPVSDAVANPPHFEEPSTARTFFDHVPERMYDYDSVANDRQPQVYATDSNAEFAAATQPYERSIPITSKLQDARDLRQQMSEVVEKQAAAEQVEQSNSAAELVERKEELIQQELRRE